MSATAEAIEQPLADLPECSLCCAWIDPHGIPAYVNMGRDGWGSHCSVARQIGDESGGRELDQKGYLHLSYGHAYMGGRGEPTQAQLDLVFDLAMEIERRNGGPRSVSKWMLDYIKLVQEGLA